MMRRAVLAGLAALAAAGFARAQGAETFVYDPFVPTPHKIVERMLALAEVGPEDLVVDLGSGDGRIVIAAAKEFGARAIGVEIDRSLVEQAEASARKHGVANRVRFVARDLFDADLREATVLTLYLLPETNRKLLPKILAEMPAGARVVSHRFHVGDWRPESMAIVDVEDDWSATGPDRELYLYRVPARVAGEWEVVREGGAGAFRLTLGQTYQFIGGSATAGTTRVELERAVLQGRDIRFVVPGAGALAGDYAGTVDGDAMTGHMVGDDRTRWRAVRPARQ
jgi:SAM-dependent methyltransferase